MAKIELTDRELMQIAIAEMNRSINEPRPDGKVPPKVGAVILFPNGKIETAYRGELREGDHAEYTLLERKLINEDLSECVLFTTLEPCVSRNDPKVPCCKRTTNARIKKVYIGIEDKDPTVDGKGIKHLINHGVEVKMFDRDLQKIIEQENAKFLEQALERKREKEKADLREPLELVISTYNISKFSDQALQKFIDEAKLPFKIKDETFLEYLSDFGALEWDVKSKTYKPTGFGVLLFGKNPRSKYPQAVLKAHVTYGNNAVEPIDFDQPLVLIPDLVEEWLFKVLPLAKDTTSFKRKDVPSFPIKVLREAIINAIVHRNYEIREAKCSLEINDNKIVIKSPGRPLSAISLDDLNTFKAPSLSRNPIITYVFSLMNYAEEKGFGMESLKSVKNEFGLPFPTYSMKEPFLTLTFLRNTEAIKEVVNNDSILELSNEELVAFEIFRNNKSITKSEFAISTGLPSRTAERLLKKFTDLKLISKLGAGPNISYLINL